MFQHKFTKTDSRTYLGHSVPGPGLVQENVILLCVYCCPSAPEHLCDHLVRDTCDALNLTRVCAAQANPENPLTEEGRFPPQGYKLVRLPCLDSCSFGAR